MVPVLSMLSFFETWMLSAMKQATQDCFLEIHNVPLDIHVCWGGAGRSNKCSLTLLVQVVIADLLHWFVVQLKLTSDDPVWTHVS